MLLSETRWRDRGCALLAHVPDSMRAWLLDDASLTRRLQGLCPGRFRVQVIRQRWARPDRNEAQMLGICAGRAGLIREVHLYCGDTPVVYARTVIPARTLRGAGRRLRGLGSRPLGAFLFANPGMRRSRSQIACLQPGQPEFVTATSIIGKAPSEIWGRRSLFKLAGRPLLVAEVFLPMMPPFPTDT